MYIVKVFSPCKISDKKNGLLDYCLKKNRVTISIDGSMESL